MGLILPPPKIARMVRYAKRRLEHPEESGKASLAAAGYKPTIKPVSIESSDTYQQIRLEIAAAAKRHKATAEDAIEVLADVMHDTQEQARDRVRSVEVLAKMAGYNAPERVESTHQSVHVGILVQQLQHTGQSLGDLLKSGTIQVQAREVA